MKKMKGMAAPALSGFSGNGEKVERDILIITSGGLWIPVRSSNCDCAASGYIHGGLKENNAKIVPLQNFEDVLGFLLTPKLKMKPDSRAYNPDTKAVTNYILLTSALTELQLE
ncbi:Uncharacterized protein Fot_35255 [Forsythia ovata]|uniref:Uncharacterized protein n=1 Tax=Forsythia ovata TaxID=205694 RepID=A0ABD1SL07_9LAMI